MTKNSGDEITQCFEREVFDSMGEAGVERGARIVVAVSGGADSVALLAALNTVGFECIVAHCNFRLRGEESLRDRRFVESLSDNLNLDLAVKDFNVAERVRQTGESVEMACRELRYSWFHDLLEREQARAIAVGHHKEDNIETFMLNLLRGTGINGLTGIKLRNGLIVRPMLRLSRGQIEQYLEAKHLGFIVDSSNLADEYRRNKLRLNVLPEIERNFPGSMDAILATIGNLAPAARFYNSCARREIEKFMLSDSAIDLKALKACQPEAEILLYEFLRGYGFNHTQTCDALRASDSSGKKFSSPGYLLEVDRGKGYLFAKTVGGKSKAVEPDITEISLNRDILNPVNIEIRRHSIAEFKPLRDRNMMYLDISALGSSEPWYIRAPHAGDRMKPYGMTGSKLISDILTDAKFTSEQKRNTRLLMNGDRVIWVIGLRASAHYPVTPASRQFLSLKFVSPTPLEK